MQDKKKIQICANGPYKVTGNITVKQTFIVPDEDNKSKSWQDGKIYENPGETYYLCRCGHSRQKPYCDGSHAKVKFNGKETASHDNFIDNAKKYNGETVDMLDNRNFCAAARFCDRGENAWHMIKNTSNPEFEQMAIDEVCSCPSGRLVIADKEGNAVEPELEQEIGMIQDVAADCKGPLWVKGEIAIEDAEGKAYETRNRVTLCRCGESSNLPFCDASHLRCPHMRKLDE